MNLIIPGLENSSTAGFLHKLDPRIKIISFIFLIGVVMFTPNINRYKFLAYFVLLIFLLIISKISLKNILFRLLILLPLLIFLSLTLVFFSPEPLSEKTVIVCSLSIKSGLIFICFSLLFITTDFYSFLKGLERLKIPGIIIAVLNFAYRYLFLFFRKGQNFKFAWMSRCCQKKIKPKQIIRLVTIIPYFLSRVFDHSIRIYAAMLSRGFQKKMPSLNDLRLKKFDYGFAFFFNSLLLGIVVIL